MSIKSKVGVITGGTTGIGFETAKRALLEGATSVVITGQSEERLEKAREQLSEFGDVRAFRWRAEESADSLALADFLANDFDSIDFVFANAGVCWPGPVESLKEDEVQRQLMVNVTGPLLLAQRLVPLMKNGGSFVFTTSCLNEIGAAGNSVYAASKAALRSLARSLSAEYKEQGVRFNTLAPGPVETPIHGKYGIGGEELDAMMASVATMVPMGRFGELEEVAPAAVFLLSDSSKYMLGEELAVDGGWSNL